jgi:hypothetical protein
MATRRIVVGASWTGRAVVIASQVPSEWLGEAAERSSGGGVILSVCRLPLCMSFTLLHELREVGPEMQLTYATARRIRFQPDDIFADLMLGWWVSSESTNHSKQLKQGPQRYSGTGSRVKAAIGDECKISLKAQFFAIVTSPCLYALMHVAPRLL